MSGFSPWPRRGLNPTPNKVHFLCGGLVTIDRGRSGPWTGASLGSSAMASARSCERNLTFAAIRCVKGCWVEAGAGGVGLMDAFSSIETCSGSCTWLISLFGWSVKDDIRARNGVEEDSAGLVTKISGGVGSDGSAGCFSSSDT